MYYIIKIAASSMGLQQCWMDCTNKRDVETVQTRPFLRVRERGTSGIAMFTEYIGQGAIQTVREGGTSKQLCCPGCQRVCPFFCAHEIAPDRESIKLTLQALASACKDWSAAERACNLSLLEEPWSATGTAALDGTQEAAHECIPDQ